MVPSSDRDSDFFDVFKKILQEDTLARFLFMICLDFGLRMPIDLMKKRKDFPLIKAKSKLRAVIQFNL